MGAVVHTAVNWDTIAINLGGFATFIALVVVPVSVWLRRHGADWVSEKVREAAESVIHRLVIPRLDKVETTVHKMRGEVTAVAQRVTYLEGLEAGKQSERSLQRTMPPTEPDGD